jgi:hypothetical protein
VRWGGHGAHTLGRGQACLGRVDEIDNHDPDSQPREDFREVCSLPLVPCPLRTPIVAVAVTVAFTVAAIAEVEHTAVVAAVAVAHDFFANVFVGHIDHSLADGVRALADALPPTKIALLWIWAVQVQSEA